MTARDGDPVDAPAGAPTAAGEVERGRALMAEAGAAIIDGVEQEGARWVVAAVTRILDAWGRCTAAEREAAIAEAVAAGPPAAARVAAELRALFARPAAEQRRTPLQVVRMLAEDVTPILRRAGVPPVERDPFEERALPDDVYGIAPGSLAELGDDDLGAALLAWGMGKTAVLRAGAIAPDSYERD